MDTPQVDWEALRAPFNPDEVDFRIQSSFNRNGKQSAIVVAYVDARTVQDRLDTVIGPQHWAFDWEPVAVVNGTVVAAKGTLTIHGMSKSDVGDPGKTEPTKASVSDALKRAAVMWGIGRYLYALPVMYADVEKRGNAEVIPTAEMNRLRAALPGGSRQTDRQPASQPRQATQRAPQAQTSTPRPQPAPEPPQREQASATTTHNAGVTDQQRAAIERLCAGLGRPLPEKMPTTFVEASQMITALTTVYKQQRAAQAQKGA